jgi:hypothetical protein
MSVSWPSALRQRRRIATLTAVPSGRTLGRTKAAEADALESPAVGEGTDVRFATGPISGAVLVREGCVVHAAVHRSQ